MLERQARYRELKTTGPRGRDLEPRDAAVFDRGRARSKGAVPLQIIAVAKVKPDISSLVRLSNC
jgi:hypothetical protein